ncbi:2-aminoethylphosphonate--pyruvate transaminase [Desulfospira joergensenii]|uniref:2-aminoethylphosphonate--pyruvate transaminase n=1 Tax=Desulfospira joergensenii TaxID=53329 RepID=UPI0003B399A4|nr:2-aminoethylphosphonate--pyruvate transaminase [Desulfospira joergensenii]
MDQAFLPENPYLLLTPGPLTTTPGVKAAMLRDWCTWDADYNRIVEKIRNTLVRLAAKGPGYTAVLMQGSGTFSVEACLTTAIPKNGKLLVLANGAYGRRISLIARRQNIDYTLLDSGDLEPPDPEQLEKRLEMDPKISHVAVVHCETTTGMLNPVDTISEIVHRFNKVFIVDAMSSFGGVPMDMAGLNIDFLISSANKCIQGVPGFGFVIARQSLLEQTEGNARSLSLDLYDQWHTMEAGRGKWRFTSPTHVVRAFAQALEELDQEGGVDERFQRYSFNNRYLITHMREMGFIPLLEDEFQSPIITAFLSPDHPEYEFMEFYTRLKDKGFVIYPGKVTQTDTFRIGNIGDIHPPDMERLVKAVKSSVYWK